MFSQCKVLLDSAFRDLRWFSYGRRTLYICGEKDGTLGLN